MQSAMVFSSSRHGMITESSHPIRWPSSADAELDGNVGDMEQPCESRAFFGTVETLVALVYMKGCDRGGCLVSQRQPGKFRCATVSLSHDIDAAEAMGYRSGLQAVA